MAKNESNLNTAPMAPAPIAAKRPNEAGTIRVEAHMRIFDPKTGQTLVEGRA